MKRYPRMGFAHRGGQSLPQTLTAALLVAVLSLPGSVRAGDPAMPKPSDKRYAVKTYRNLTYHNVPRDPDRKRHQLDVFQPKGRTGCPVLFFVHGGGWVIGGKDDVFGIYGYGTIARCLAQRGFVVVLPNYRLSPRVRHPEHIKDVARAFAWTCRNAARYGGDPNRIVVAGHSAGGHLVSLLAMDPTYLEAEGRSRKDIQAVIAISGVYRLQDFELDLSAATPCQCLKLPARIRPLAVVFGANPEVLKQASPINHVRPGLPPFLLLSAGFDYHPLRRMTKDFAAALKKNGCEVRVKVISWRTHETMVFDILRQTAEPKMIETVVKFIDAVPASHADGGLSLLSPASGRRE